MPKTLVTFFPKGVSGSELSVASVSDTLLSSVSLEDDSSASTLPAF